MSFGWHGAKGLIDTTSKFWSSKIQKGGFIVFFIFVVTNKHAHCMECSIVLLQRYLDGLQLNATIVSSILIHFIIRLHAKHTVYYEI